MASMTDSVVITDAEGNFVQFNDAFTAFYRFASRAECAKNFSEIAQLFDVYTVDGEPAPQSAWALPRALRGESATAAEYMFRRKDTGQSWFGSLSFSPIRDEAGAILGAVVSAHDVTEAKRAEGLLKTTLERFYTILSNLNSSVLLVADDGRVEFANQAYCDRFGLAESPAELAGLDAETMIARIKSAYREPETAVARIAQLLKQGEAVLGEELPTRDGGTCIRDFIPLRVEGKSYGRLWVHTDITQLKRTEARLRRFYEAAVFGVLYWKIDGGVVDANDKFLEMTGYTREDMRAGIMDWSAMTPPEYRELDEAARREVSATGIHLPYEKEFLRKDGTRIWVLISAAAWEDDRSEGVSFALDITDRKQAETELAEARFVAELSATQLMTIFDNVEERLYVCDRAGNVIVANDVSRATYSADRQAPAPSVPEMHDQVEVFDLGGRRLAPYEWPIERILRGERVRSTEIRVRFRGTGLERILSCNGSPIFDQDGGILMAVMTSSDITERNKAENALIESEKRYRSLFDSMTEGFCVVEMFFDAEGRAEDYRIVEANAAFERQTGLHGALGKRMSEIEPRLARSWCEIYGKVAATGEAAHFIEESKALNRYFDVNAYRVGEPEERRVAVLFSDFSDFMRAQEVLKKSEAQFRTLADAIPQLCWTANADGWLNWYNRRWYEYTGTTPEQMEGWGWQSVHDAEALPHVLEVWRTSIATGSPFEMVFPLRGADGVFRPFLTRATPVKDEDGRVVRWFGTNTDISDQKQIEAELRRSEERLNVALEVAGLGEWERDLKTGAAFRSQRHAHIFGYTSTEGDWNFEKFLSHILPEDRARVTEWYRSSLRGGILGL